MNVGKKCAARKACPHGGFQRAGERKGLEYHSRKCPNTRFLKRVACLSIKSAYSPALKHAPRPVGYFSIRSTHSPALKRSPRRVGRFSHALCPCARQCRLGTCVPHHNDSGVQSDHALSRMHCGCAALDSSGSFCMRVPLCTAMWLASSPFNGSGAQSARALSSHAPLPKRGPRCVGLFLHAPYRCARQHGQGA